MESHSFPGAGTYLSCPRAGLQEGKDLHTSSLERERCLHACFCVGRARYSMQRLSGNVGSTFRGRKMIQACVFFFFGGVVFVDSVLTPGGPLNSRLSGCLSQLSFHNRAEVREGI